MMLEKLCPGVQKTMMYLIEEYPACRYPVGIDEIYKTPPDSMDLLTSLNCHLNSRELYIFVHLSHARK